jgi:hypothetical protein
MIREGKWDCLHCKTTNLGRNTDCESCGAVRGKDVVFYLEDEAPEVKDEAMLSDALAGPDWNCKYCGTNNRANRDWCSQCGYRSDSDNVEPPQPLIEDQIKKEEIAYEKEKVRTDIKPYLIIGTAVLFGITALWWMFSTYEVQSTVVEKSWTHTIETQDYKTVRERDWDIPSRGRYVSESREVHHHVQEFSHYETRTRQVSHRVRTGSRTVTHNRNKGNGYFETTYSQEPVYETRNETETYRHAVYVSKPIYRQKYTYDIEKWVSGQSYITTGVGIETNWSSPPFSEVKRESRRYGQYHTIFKPLEETLDGIDHKTSDKVEWLRYAMGRKYIVVKNHFGVICEIK